MINWHQIQFILFEFGKSICQKELLQLARQTELLMANWPLKSSDHSGIAEIFAVMSAWQFSHPKNTPRQLMPLAINLSMQAPDLSLRQYIQYAAFFKQSFHIHWLAMPKNDVSVDLIKRHENLIQIFPDAYVRWRQRLKLMGFNDSEYIAIPVHPITYKRIKDKGWMSNVICIAHIQKAMCHEGFYDVCIEKDLNHWFEFKPHVLDYSIKTKNETLTIAHGLARTGD